MGKYGRPDINPYDRDLDLTVPLTYRNKLLGDIPVHLTFDDRFLIQTQPFLDVIGAQLNSSARAALTARLDGKSSFSNDDIANLGISLTYDPSALAVVLLRIDPDNRSVERLFEPPTHSDEKPDILPAHFSAYLNLNLVQSYYWQGGNGAPTIGMNGAMRLGSIVFEGDAQLTDQSNLTGAGGGYSFDRNYARFVYDQPDDYRRWYLGDLSIETRGQQGYVQMGGIGVVRQRRTFDQYRSSILQANRQLILQRDADVRILRNGTLFREMHLDAGAYDFSALPLVSGSNDVQIEVRDASGQVQTLSYGSYLDPIDLEPGDYEYGAYLGRTSQRFGQSPQYDGPIAFSGYFRKAFLNAPAIGVGLQLSADVQVVTGQTQLVLGNGGRLMLDAGASNSRGSGKGYAVGLGYDQIFDRGDLVDSFSLRADVLSRRFSGLGTPDADNPAALTLNAQYTRAFTPKFTLLFSGTYTRNRNDLGDSYRISASANYYISRQWSVRGGIDYTRYPRLFGSSLNDGLGVQISLVWQPNYRERAEARYESNTETATASYSRASSDRIGSVGFGAIAGRDYASANAQGYVDYTGNRFDATVSHATYGDDFSHFGQNNVTSLRVGTSLAFADGVFGIGHRINDSFAVLYPHSTLEGHSVVAGQSLAESEYLSKSGTFGAAVNNVLTSYVTQSIPYDIENPPLGYDLGPGVRQAKPPYHSGYKLRVGSDAFVSAAGTLVGANGKPISLASGRLIAADGQQDASPPFFTNTVGRFAVSNLRPGVHYRVELFGKKVGFEFNVPTDTTGFVDLKTIRLAPSQEEKP
jgi:outer membrane usher protein